MTDPRAWGGRSPDVVVVGGGIVGASAAAFLAGGGARVMLIEREGLAAGASGANSGVLQHPFDPVLAGLYRASLDLYRGLAAEGAGFRLPPGPAGMLFVSDEPSDVARLASSVARTFPELAPLALDPASVRALEPTLAPDLHACRVEIGFPIAPAAPTYAYATLAERRGVRIRLGREASLALDGDRVRGVLIEGAVVEADAVLVAAGPWTSGLVDPSGRWAPIRPRWGVVVETRLADPPGHVLEEAAIDEVIGAAASAGTPSTAEEAVDFSLVTAGAASAVGSTFLELEPDPASWVVPLLERGSRFVPGLADAPVTGARACARPQSIDGLPLVGRLPWLRGLFVCAGHGPWGISTGPASAALVADLILGRGPAIPGELDPGRFGRPA